MNRQPDLGFDQRIADWLQNDPMTAPPAVLSTVLAAVPSIHQRRAPRVPWRLPTMNVRMLGLTGAAIVAVLALAALTLPRANGPGATASVGPSPSLSPASGSANPAATVHPSASITATPVPSFTVRAGPSSFDQVFFSPLYRYGMRYPSAWTVAGGTQPNYPDHLPNVVEKRSDFFSDGNSSGVFVTSAPATALHPDLESFTGYVATWIPKTYSIYTGHGCTDLRRTVDLDGEPAIELDYLCPAHSALWAVTIHDGLAYQVAWLDDGPFSADDLRARFDGFLESFTFAP